MNLLNLLGIPTHKPTAGIPAGTPGLNPMSSLLGPEAQAPENVGTDEIVATGQRLPTMSPEALGMPGMPAMRSPDEGSIADLRDQLKAKADIARQLYHKNSEFGTHGLLRDIVGNAADFGRRLLGFSPRYNEEKWLERAYGMTSSNPDVAAAAREQAMQYNPMRTMAYGEQLDQDKYRQTNADANAEYKNTMVANRQAQVISGYGQGLLNMSLKNPQAAQAQYERAKPMIEQLLGGEQLPDQYSDDVGNYLAARGYGGAQVQRERGAVLNSATQRQIAQLRSDTQQAIAGANNSTKLRVAQIMSDTSKGRAELEAQVRRELGLAPETRTETESGSIIHPTKTTTTTKGGAAPAAPQRKFFNGKWYVRGPNGEAVPE